MLLEASLHGTMKTPVMIDSSNAFINEITVAINFYLPRAKYEGR